MCTCMYMYAYCTMINKQVTFYENTDGGVKASNTIPSTISFNSSLPARVASGTPPLPT